MKLPTAESQGPEQEKSQGKRPNAPHKGGSRQKTGQSAKLQTAKPLQQLLRKLADFKLSKPLLVSNQKKAQGASESKDAQNKDVSPESAVLTSAPLPSKPSASAARLPFIKDSKGSRLAANLLLVRPWFLLAGFWVFSLLGASIAVEGMISPRRLKMDLPETAEVTPAESENAFVKVEPSADEPLGQGNKRAESQVDAEKATSIKISPTGSAAESGTATSASAIEGRQTAANASSFPTVPLVALVGTCAAGCLLISRRRAMMRIAAARSRSRRVRPKSELIAAKGLQKPSSARTAPVSLISSPTKGKAGKTTARRAAKPSVSVLGSQSASSVVSSGLSMFSRGKKRRQRNKRMTAGGQARLGSRKLISRSTAQQAAGPASKRVDGKSAPKPGPKTGPKTAPKSGADARVRSRTVRGQRVSNRVAGRRQGVVSVVPANESHALDWSNGSLAHELDVRPQRTASM